MTRPYAIRRKAFTRRLPWASLAVMAALLPAAAAVPTTNAIAFCGAVLAQRPDGGAGLPVGMETGAVSEEARQSLLAIPEHDTFESIALGDWMLRLAYFIAVLFTTGFAVTLPFVPWLIRVRGVQRVAYFFYSLAFHAYYLFRHILWSVRWLLLGVFILLLCFLFVYLLSAGTESMLE